MARVLPTIHFAHHLLRARDWQDRPQLDAVCDWWRAGGAGVCALVGIGGAGKTAVADRFLQLVPGVLPAHPDVPKRPDLPTPPRLMVFSFYDAPNADAFFAELAAWLDDSPPDRAGGDQADRAASYEQIRIALAASAQEHPVLLVLDGLEKVQDDGARGGLFGQINDGRLRDFILWAADCWLPGVSLLITSRFRLFDALAHRCLFFREISVAQLTPGEAVALLRARGVTKGSDEDLRRIAREQGRHALTVDLIGGYIGRFCKGDPRKLPPHPHVPDPEPSEDPEIAAIRQQEHKFARVAKRYAESFAATDPAALALLQRVCLFRLGVSAEILADVFTGQDKADIAGAACYQQAGQALADGLRIARECGYGIFHIDLLLLRARLALLQGDPAAAAADIRLALTDGIPACDQTGAPPSRPPTTKSAPTPGPKPRPDTSWPKPTASKPPRRSAAQRTPRPAPTTCPPTCNNSSPTPASSSPPPATCARNSRTPNSPKPPPALTPWPAAT